MNAVQAIAFLRDYSDIYRLVATYKDLSPQEVADVTNNLLKKTAVVSIVTAHDGQ